MEGKKVPVYWEEDLILGKGSKSGIGILIERKNRKVFLVPLKTKNAKTVAENFSEVFEETVPLFKKNLTYNLGIEMAEHKKFTKRFADPHAPCQRGNCENTNMLLRDFFPKRTDLSNVTKKKSSGYKTD